MKPIATSRIARLTSRSISSSSLDVFDRFTRHRAVSGLLLATAVVVLSGCSASPWSETYIGQRDPEAARLAQEGRAHPVNVRSIPWERLQTTLDELRQEVVTSDIHPDEWSVEKKDAAKARLLKGLQVSDAPERILVLGHSEFRTTDTIRPETEQGQADLLAFARQVGADMVVWSGRSYGKVDRVVQEPVTTFSTGTDWSRHDGRNRPSSFSETSTTWVPVRVQLDELGYIAYFLRHHE